MRRIIATLALSILFAIPVLAQTSDAKRLAELEKANIVLHDDMAKAQLQLSLMNDRLEKAINALTKVQGDLATERNNRLQVEDLLKAETTARQLLVTQLASMRTENENKIAALIVAQDKKIADERLYASTNFATLNNDIDRRFADSKTATDAQFTLTRSDLLKQMGVINDALVASDNALRSDLLKSNNERTALDGRFTDYQTATAANFTILRSDYDKKLGEQKNDYQAQLTALRNDVVAMDALQTKSNLDLRTELLARMDTNQAATDRRINTLHDSVAVDLATLNSALGQATGNLTTTTGDVRDSLSNRIDRADNRTSQLQRALIILAIGAYAAHNF
ncbi:MAG: hypothetical protein WCJ56_01215 [bacterium]